MKVGTLVETWRCEKKVSRAMLALDLSVSTEHIRRIENGESNPSVEILEKMIEKLEPRKESSDIAWVLLAEDRLGKDLLKKIEIGPRGYSDRFVDLALEWMRKKMKLTKNDEVDLFAYIEEKR